MTDHQRIVLAPEVLTGKPIIRGTRLSVAFVVGLMADGWSESDILTNYPDVYLYGCLVEAAIFTQGEAEAQRYLQLYNASVAGLNARTQRITASANPVIRVRAGMVV